MASVNRIILIGNLGRDPEIKYMPNGEPVCNFSIATTDSWKDKQGQKQDRTEWHRISIFNKLAEIASEYLKKGSSVYIEGRLQTRKWQDGDGNERQFTEVVADRMQMIGSRGGNDSSSSSRDSHDLGDQSGGSRQSSNRQPDNSFDDDIPF